MSEEILGREDVIQPLWVQCSHGSCTLLGSRMPLPNHVCPAREPSFIWPLRHLTSQLINPWYRKKVTIRTKGRCAYPGRAVPRCPCSCTISGGLVASHPPDCHSDEPLNVAVSSVVPLLPCEDRRADPQALPQHPGALP